MQVSSTMKLENTFLKRQAFQELLNGHRVSNYYWEDYEYLTMDEEGDIHVHDRKPYAKAFEMNHEENEGWFIYQPK